MPKAAHWPSATLGQDRASQVDIDSLPLWPAADHEGLATIVGQMFTIEEMLRKAKGTQYESAAMHDPSFDLRETIQILFVRAFRDGYKRHSIKLKGDDPKDEARISVLIKSLRKTAKGLPLLELIVPRTTRTRARFWARARSTWRDASTGFWRPCRASTGMRSGTI